LKPERRANNARQEAERLTTAEAFGHSKIARRRYDGALATGADPRSDGIALVACQSI